MTDKPQSDYERGWFCTTMWAGENISIRYDKRGEANRLYIVTPDGEIVRSENPFPDDKDEGLRKDIQTAIVAMTSP